MERITLDEAALQGVSSAIINSFMARWAALPQETQEAAREVFQAMKSCLSHPDLVQFEEAMSLAALHMQQQMLASDPHVPSVLEYPQIGTVTVDAADQLTGKQAMAMIHMGLNGLWFWGVSAGATNLEKEASKVRGFVRQFESLLNELHRGEHSSAE